MIDFAYARAESPATAVAALRDDHATVLAGGTELLNWVRLGIAAPERVVDIGGLDELRGITRDGDTLRIGALTTLNEIGEHPLAVAHAGALASACLQAASAQIRNRATLGGNVLQRTRCAYFRAEEPVPWPCNRRSPGSGCAALAGLHERHAIFGWTDECVAVHPSDPAVALVALDAVVDVVGPAGPRAVPSTGFHLTPEEAGLREHRLDPDELIVGTASRSSPARRPTSRSASGRPTSTRSSRRPPSWAPTARGWRSARWRANPGACPTWSACRSPGRPCCPPSRNAWQAPTRCRTTGSR
jgi:xanthine dehydrogenase YagS FAD-binding subunit